MANPIVQRLIAAGASPARANAFATQFAKSQPSVKTQDLEDAFDEQLGALSQTYFPNVFRPPAVDDPRFDDYVKFIYGPDALQKIETQVLTKNAPTYAKALNSTVAYEKKLASAIKQGFTLAQIQQAILSDFKNNDPALLEFPIVKTTAYDPATTADVVEGINSYANKLYDDYVKVAPALTEAKTKIFDSNKYYKAGLPDPKLKYGKTEDLSKGIISFETHPQVEKALKNIPAPILAKSPETRITSQLPSQPSSMPLYDKANPKEAFFKEFSSSKANPLKDEITRREYLKDKTTR